jgi:uncharacterized membrane protein
MPFCSSCGKVVHDRDVFCANCGTQQPVHRAAPLPPQADPLQGISPRTASILCYVPVIGWIAAVVVLASRRFRGNPAVRFHAFQGLYLFAAWLFVDWTVRPVFRSFAEPVFRLDRVLEGLIFAASIFMIVKASHEEVYSLPIIGELAHRSATES